MKAQPPSQRSSELIAEEHHSKSPLAAAVDIQSEKFSRLKLKNWTQPETGLVVELAKPGARFGALIVDVVFTVAVSSAVFIFFLTLGMFFTYNGRWEDAPEFATLIRILLFALQLQVPLSLFLIDTITAVRNRETIGQRAANLEMVKATKGVPLGWRESILRSSVSFGLLVVQSFLLIATLFLPNDLPKYIDLFSNGTFMYVPFALTVLAHALMLFNKKHQGIHDVLSKTLVVVKQPKFSYKPYDNAYEDGHVTLQTGATLQLASYFSRFLARCIDLTIMLLFSVTFLLLTFLLTVVVVDRYLDDVIGTSGIAIILAAFAFVGLCSVIYYENSMVALRGQTIGKMIMNIKIVKSTDSSLPGWDQSAARMIIFCSLGGLFSCVPVLWDKERQAAHDMGASTVVVRTAPARLQMIKTISAGRFWGIPGRAAPDSSKIESGHSISDNDSITSDVDKFV